MSLDSSFNITLDSNDASFKILGDEKLRITSLGNVGIGTTSPEYPLTVEGITSSKTRKTFDFSGSDNHARHFWICSFHDSGGGHNNILIKINYSAQFKRMTGTHSRNSIATGTATYSSLWYWPTNVNGGVTNLNTLYDQKEQTYSGQGNIPKWYYVRFNDRGYLVLAISISDANDAQYRITGNIDFLTTGTAEETYVWNGSIFKDVDTRGTTGFSTISNLYPTSGTSEAGWDTTMTSSSTAQEMIEAQEGTIFSKGNVGIGTTVPYGKLDINNTHGSGDRGRDHLYTIFNDYFGWRWYSRWNNRYWDIRYNTGGAGDVLHVFYQGNTEKGGFFDPNQDVGTFTFTGQHRNFVEDIPSTEAEDYKGLIVSANKNAYYDIDYSIKTGRDAITINDALPYVSLCKTEKDKSCYGVISDGEDEESRKYSSGTFVSVSEKQYGDNRMFINSVGEGAIWVSNKNGNLESGDYITTASIPGYGQKQDSEFLANYTVAKITMDCNFQPDYIYKKKLITRNVDITGPDASGNYYDVLNNERLYTIDLNNEITNNKNNKYTLTFDDADNLIGATQNILDPNGEIQWEDSTEQEYAYDIRYVDATGNIITKQQHDRIKSNGGLAYIAAFVGCTYHCG